MTDWITQRILKNLDSEKTTNEICNQIGVARKSVYYRLKKLEKSGEIEKRIHKNNIAIWQKN